MTLTSPVFFALLFGALLHASWNALIKSATDKALDTGLVHSLGVLFAVPLLLYTGLPSAAAWPYIALSSLVHIAYYTALAGAYEHGDLGLTYPLMRGTAPLLVALGSHALIGERLSLAAWMGVAGICAGVIVLGLSSRRAEGGSSHSLKPVFLALLNALIIAIYTVVDGLGVRAAGDAGAYVAALFLFDGIPYLALVLRGRSPAERAQAWSYMVRRARVAWLGTVASLGSYAIALWAMTRAPVAVVAALRETSVLFAVVLGMVLLRERLSAHRAAGVLIMLAGVLALRLG